MTGYSSIPDSEAERRLFAEVKAERAGQARAMVLSDITGRAFWWACASCRLQGVTRLSKERAQGERDRHNLGAHEEEPA